MSRTDDLFALTGKSVARDPKGKKPDCIFLAPSHSMMAPV